MRVFLMALFCFSIFLSPCYASNTHILNDVYLDEDSVRFSDSNGIFTGSTEGISFIVFNNNRSKVITMYLGEDGFFKPIDIYHYGLSEKLSDNINKLEKLYDYMPSELQREAKDTINNAKHMHRNAPFTHYSDNETLKNLYCYMQDYTSNHWDEIYVNSTTKGQRIQIK